MRRFSLLEEVGKRLRRSLPASFAAGLLAGALVAGCGAVEQEQAAGRQGLGEQEKECSPNGAGDCFVCSDLLEAPCICKDAAGRVGPCAGAELAACQADHEQQYQGCVRTETCERDVLQPKLAACPDKRAPGGEACILAAYEAYSACVAPGGGGGGGPGGGTGGGTGG